MDQGLSNYSPAEQGLPVFFLQASSLVGVVAFVAGPWRPCYDGNEHRECRHTIGGMLCEGSAKSSWLPDLPGTPASGCLAEPHQQVADLHTASVREATRLTNAVCGCRLWQLWRMYHLCTACL